jgi:hypothetical protein
MSEFEKPKKVYTNKYAQKVVDANEAMREHRKKYALVRSADGSVKQIER